MKKEANPQVLITMIYHDCAEDDELLKIANANKATAISLPEKTDGTLKDEKNDDDSKSKSSSDADRVPAATQIATRIATGIATRIATRIVTRILLEKRKRKEAEEETSSESGNPESSETSESSPTDSDFDESEELMSTDSETAAENLAKIVTLDKNIDALAIGS